MKHLRLNENCIIDSESGDVLVKRGSVNVFLSPVENGRSLRRMFLGTAFISDVIYAPLKREKSERKWELVLNAREDTDLSDEAFTGEPRLNEAYINGSVFRISHSPGYPSGEISREDFWELVKKLYIQWEEEQRQNVYKKTEISGRSKEGALSRIGSLLRGSFEYEISSMEITGEPLYDACAFLCKIRKINIAPVSRIKKACSGSIDTSQIARISGFACRSAGLSKDWKKTTFEPFLAEFDGEDGKEGYTAVVFRRAVGICVFNPVDRSIHRLDKNTEKNMNENVCCFIKPFPDGKVTLKTMVNFCLREISIVDVMIWLVSMYLVTKVGLGLSSLTAFIYGRAIFNDETTLAYAMGTLFFCGVIANFLFLVTKNLTYERVSLRMTHAVQSAVYDRVLHMEEAYFRGKESAAQAFRILSISDMYVNVILNAIDIILQFLFSMFYFARMIKLAPSLASVGMFIAVVQALFTILQGILSRKLSVDRMQKNADIRSFLYQSINGITTVRAAGAEDQILLKAMDKESELARNRLKNDRLTRIGQLCFSFITGLGFVMFYALMGEAGGRTGVGSFMGFITANSFFSMAFMQVSQDAFSIFTMIPLLKDAGGILAEIPEKPGRGQMLEDFEGDVVLSHVSFSYTGSEQRVLKDVSLHITPGEYVGIAGPSGCGKSTMIRLLLGFSRPQMGQIYYDGMPVDKLDITELRRRMGCVLQDGSLFAGNIKQNISISRPDATEEEIWEALELAGMKKDVERMPLKLMTYISEESGNISGGQKQRLMLARAILGSPEILILDEATSALDNITQDAVVDNLKSLNATRIVVAHRLSTLKGCDRIIFMEKGQIKEEGNYEVLMEKKGRFYEMVKIQQAV